MRWGMLLGLFLVIPGTAHEEAMPPAILPTTSQTALHCAAPDDEAQLVDITQEWKRNYNAGNAAGVAALYTPEAIYLTQHYVTGVVAGRRAIQAYVQRGVNARAQVDKIEVLRTECSGDMAYVVDRYTATNAGQTAMGVNLVVLCKLGGQWRIVAHEAAVPDPATAVQQLDIPKD